MPAQRAEQAWTEGVAIWVAVLVVSLVGEPCILCCIPIAQRLRPYCMPCALRHASEVVHGKQCLGEISQLDCSLHRDPQPVAAFNHTSACQMY